MKWMQVFFFFKPFPVFSSSIVWSANLSTLELIAFSVYTIFMWLGHHCDCDWVQLGVIDFRFLVCAQRIAYNFVQFLRAMAISGEEEEDKKKNDFDAIEIRYDVCGQWWNHELQYRKKHTTRTSAIEFIYFLWHSISLNGSAALLLRQNLIYSIEKTHTLEGAARISCDG